MSQPESDVRSFRNIWMHIKTRLLWQVIIVVAGIVVIAAIALSLISASFRSRADKVAGAVRASFPDFCPDGQILAEVSTMDGRPINGSASGRYWGVRCDTWLKSPTGFYGYVTIVDTDQCTTVRPLMGTLSIYFEQFETLNSSNGKKMAVCP